ncbi:hypothetical protein, partial [Peribacillus simplex]|uniref:hypothetical protein n=1 Tax=Peribacillus simplex TaxID=1478 RepID=UPI001E640C06
SSANSTALLSRVPSISSATSLISCFSILIHPSIILLYVTKSMIAYNAYGRKVREELNRHFH